MKAKVLISCPLGRWKAGEVGEVLINESDKYNFFLEFPFKKVVSNFSDTRFIADILKIKPEEVRRRYYFYANEIEILED
uniref:Uncharacterized protein n=1 Tax=viral metagenome TaxID=1070528 RepID=A0A6M3IMU4_9ZZZZ